jgi:hypothetical protein
MPKCCLTKIFLLSLHAVSEEAQVTKYLQNNVLPIKIIIQKLHNQEALDNTSNTTILTTTLFRINLKISPNVVLFQNVLFIALTDQQVLIVKYSLRLF